MLPPCTKWLISAPILVGLDSELNGRTAGTHFDNFESQTALENFLISARNERFSSLLIAEQNYTEFLIAQLNIQLEEIQALTQVLYDAVGKTD